MQRKDLDAMHKLIDKIQKALPNCRKLKELLETYSQLFLAAVQGKQVTIDKDICCRTCEEWKPCESWDDDGHHIITRKEAPLGLCNTKMNDVTHDKFTPRGFFCPNHPFFKQE